MAVLVKFGRNGSPKGYLNGHKKDWKRMISKARRRKTKGVRAVDYQNGCDIHRHGPVEGCTDCDMLN